ncbi:MAG: hypothetical protein JWP04_2251 [Belnapia sp.]|nr:hypothetical protein [Belnapia sp.]
MPELPPQIDAAAPLVGLTLGRARAAGCAARRAGAAQAERPGDARHAVAGLVWGAIRPRLALLR